MRVLVVGKEAHGPAERMDREARALSGAGHDVEQLVFSTTRVMWVLRPFARVADRLRLAAHVRRVAPEVLHLVGPAFPRVMLGAARLAGARLLYESPEGSLGRPKGRFRQWAVRRAERRLVRRAVLVVARSQAAADDLRARTRSSVPPLVILDVPGDPMAATTPANLRGRLGIGNRRVVLIPGVEPADGSKAAFVHALIEVPDVHLVFLNADTWRDRDRMRMLADRLRVSGRLHLLKGVRADRLPAYSSETDAVVALADGSADHALALPAAGLAALAAGTPVVAVGCPELVRFAGPAARAVDAVTPQELAAALHTLPPAPRVPMPMSWTAEATKLVQAYGRLSEFTAPQDAAGTVWGRTVGMRHLAGALRDGLDARTIRHPLAAMRHAHGRMLRVSGRFQEAADELARAAALDPSQASYLMHAAGALKDAGRTSEAITAYRELFNRGDRRPDTMAAVAAVTLAQLGARRDAETILRVFERAAPKSDHNWVRIAEIEAALGNLDRARSAAANVAGALPRSLARVQTRALEQSGEPTAALAAARQSGLDDVDRRLTGYLRALDRSWRWERSAPVRRRLPNARGGRVLNLLESSLPHVTAGYAHRSRTVVAAQARAGWHPTVATRLGFPANRRITRFAPVESVDGVPHHRFVLPGVHRYSAVPLDSLVEANVELATRLARLVSPDVIQAATPHMNCLVALGVRAALGTPVVYDIRGFPEMTWAVRSGGQESEVYRLRREAETACMQDADLVTTLSEVMRTHIVERGVDPQRVVVVPHAVDVRALGPGPRPAALMARYRLEGRRVVGCVSSLLEYEGIDTALRALRAVRSTRSDVTVLVVGDGPARTGLERLAAELGVEDAVVFAGRVPHADVVSHYRLLDAFLVPRRNLEVCRWVAPLKPFEAMSAGVPVICSDLPVLSDIVGGEERGTQFAADDHLALADRICSVLEDHDRSMRLRAAARDHVVANHSLEALDRAVGAALNRATSHAAGALV